MTKLKAQLNAAQKAISCQQTRIKNALYELTDMHYVWDQKTTFRLLLGLPQIPASDQVQSVSKLGLYGTMEESKGEGACPPDSKDSHVNARRKADEGACLAEAEGARPDQVQRIREAIPDSPPRKAQQGLCESRSVKVAMQDNAEKCCCGRDYYEAKNLSKLRDDRSTQRPSLRLREAIQCGVDMQFLSREEAQSLFLTATDCGSGYVPKAELDSVQEKLTSLEGELEEKAAEVEKFKGAVNPLVEALNAIGQCPACGGDGVIHPECQSCLSGEPERCTCANEPAEKCPVCEGSEKAIYDQVKQALAHAKTIGL